MQPGICIVIMSFDEKYSSVYTAAIRPAVENCGFRCLRMDQIDSPRNLPHATVQQIILSDVVVADISEHSPNVFYELGISHAVGNKTIIVADDSAKVPFDLSSEYTLHYSHDGRGLELLRFQLEEYIKQIVNNKHVPSNIVQIAGRDYFDLRSKVERQLEELVNQNSRMSAFSSYLESNRTTDNSYVVESLASAVVDRHGYSNGTFFAAISGAAGLGKTTLALSVAARIRERRPEVSVSVLQTDAYMQNRSDRIQRDLSGYDPDACDIEKMIDDMRRIERGETITYHPYDHSTGTHCDASVSVSKSDVLIVEGIHAFHPRVIPRMRLKLFLYATPADAKELRFMVDLFERNYTAHAAFKHAESEFRSFEEHVLHYLRFADFVVQIDNYWKYKIVM